jgi:hypothetical protein
MYVKDCFVLSSNFLVEHKVRLEMIHYSFSKRSLEFFQSRTSRFEFWKINFLTQPVSISMDNSNRMTYEQTHRLQSIISTWLNHGASCSSTLKPYTRSLYPTYSAGRHMKHKRPLRKNATLNHDWTSSSQHAMQQLCEDFLRQNADLIHHWHNCVTNKGIDRCYASIDVWQHRLESWSFKNSLVYTSRRANVFLL